MKKILKLFVTRWLARTPLGLVVLGIGWLFTRKRRADKQQEQTTGRTRVLRERQKERQKAGDRR